ncbi:unnamed protein product, partial [Mesorhabditis spiculigera]
MPSTTILLAVLSLLFLNVDAADSEGKSFIFLFTRNSDQAMNGNTRIWVTLINKGPNPIFVTLDFPTSPANPSVEQWTNANVTVGASDYADVDLPPALAWEYANSGFAKSYDTRVYITANDTITVLANNQNNLTMQTDTFLVNPKEFVTNLAAGTYRYAVAAPKPTISSQFTVFTFIPLTGDFTLTLTVGGGQTLTQDLTFTRGQWQYYYGTNSFETHDPVIYASGNKPFAMVVSISCGPTADPLRCDHSAFMPQPLTSDYFDTYPILDDRHLTDLLSAQKFYIAPPRSDVAKFNVLGNVTQNGTNVGITTIPIDPSSANSFTFPQFEYGDIADLQSQNALIQITRMGGVPYARTGGAFLNTVPAWSQASGDQFSFVTRYPSDKLMCFINSAAFVGGSLDGQLLTTMTRIDFIEVRIGTQLIWLFVTPINTPGYHKFSPATGVTLCYVTGNANSGSAYGYLANFNREAAVKFVCQRFYNYFDDHDDDDFYYCYHDIRNRYTGDNDNRHAGNRTDSIDQYRLYSYCYHGRTQFCYSHSYNPYRSHCHHCLYNRSRRDRCGCVKMLRLVILSTAVVAAAYAEDQAAARPRDLLPKGVQQPYKDTSFQIDAPTADRSVRNLDISEHRQKRSAGEIVEGRARGVTTFNKRQAYDFPPQQPIYVPPSRPFTPVQKHRPAAPRRPVGRRPHKQYKQPEEHSNQAPGQSPSAGVGGAGASDYPDNPPKHGKPKQPSEDATRYYYPPRFPLPLSKCFHNPTGYVCCNAELNDMMVGTFTDLEARPKFHTCNIQKLANELQDRAQKRFNETFETIASFEDFAQKIHFKGDLVCKVELGGRYMLAYASVPNLSENTLPPVEGPIEEHHISRRSVIQAQLFSSATDFAKETHSEPDVPTKLPFLPERKSYEKNHIRSRSEPRALDELDQMADVDVKSVGKKVGLEVFRVHDFKLEPVPENQHGVFFVGDSYVVLKTKREDEWDLHFWLGKNSSTVFPAKYIDKAIKDEIGTAAIKAVEIDQALGGFPTQYREIEGNESPLFMSYFKNGIRYQTGGYESGFNNVEDALKDFKPRLFRCKGKRNVRCQQVEFSKESLNLGDVYILDLGRDIYVWMPPEAGRLERISGMLRAKNISLHERFGEAKVHILDDEWKTSVEFWKHFGGKEVIGSIAKAVNDDEGFWANIKDQVTLWKVSDESGEVKVEWVAMGDDVTHEKLNTNDAYVLDACTGGIFVWIGKGCSMDERGKAMHWGQSYLAQQKLPGNTQITRVLESTEPGMFIQWFSKWNDQKKKNQFEPKLYQVSDASGKLVCEEIAQFQQEDLDGDDVMILDALHAIYVWVGIGATPNEKKQATEIAKKFLEQSKLPRQKGTAIATIYQSKETPMFKKFFDTWDDDMFKLDSRSVASMRKLIFT